MLFAGLQNVPGDVIEAARLDGARFPTLLFRIIIPLLRPVIAVALIVRGIDAARAFDIILIQTNGGPQESTTTLSLLIYRTMTRYGDIGLASAMGTIYLVAMLVVATARDPRDLAAGGARMNGLETRRLSSPRDPLDHPRHRARALRIPVPVPAARPRSRPRATRSRCRPPCSPTSGRSRITSRRSRRTASFRRSSTAS